MHARYDASGTTAVPLSETFHRSFTSTKLWPESNIEGTESEGVYFAFDKFHRQEGDDSHVFVLDEKAKHHQSGREKQHEFFHRPRELAMIHEWLDALNADLRTVPEFDFFDREEVTPCRCPAICCMLPPMCCLGGVCVLLKMDKMRGEAIIKIINDKPRPVGFSIECRRAVREHRGTDEHTLWLEIRRHSGDGDKLRRRSGNSGVNIMRTTNAPDDMRR